MPSHTAAESNKRLREERLRKRAEKDRQRLLSSGKPTIGINGTAATAAPAAPAAPAAQQQDLAITSPALSRELQASPERQRKLRSLGSSFSRTEQQKKNLERDEELLAGKRQARVGEESIVLRQRAIDKADPETISMNGSQSERAKVLSEVTKKGTDIFLSDEEKALPFAERVKIGKERLKEFKGKPDPVMDKINAAKEAAGRRAEQKDLASRTPTQIREAARKREQELFGTEGTPTTQSEIAGKFTQEAEAQTQFSQEAEARLRQLEDLGLERQAAQLRSRTETAKSRFSISPEGVSTSGARQLPQLFTAADEGIIEEARLGIENSRARREELERRRTRAIANGEQALAADLAREISSEKSKQLAIQTKADAALEKSGTDRIEAEEKAKTAEFKRAETNLDFITSNPSFAASIPVESLAKIFEQFNIPSPEIFAAGFQTQMAELAEAKEVDLKQQSDESALNLQQKQANLDKTLQGLQGAAEEKVAGAEALNKALDDGRIDQETFDAIAVDLGIKTKAEEITDLERQQQEANIEATKTKTALDKAKAQEVKGISRKVSGVSATIEIEKKFKPFTAVQGKAFGFAQRLNVSGKILENLGDDISSLNTAQFILQQKLPNFLKSSTFQQFEQAKRDFINAQLRQESGAAIAASEFESADKQFFPQPGDGVVVIEQKRQNRDLAIENMFKISNRPREKAITFDEVSDEFSDIFQDKIGSIVNEFFK